MDPVRLYRLSARLDHGGRRRIAKVVQVAGFVLFHAILPREMRIGRDFHLGHHGTGFVGHPAVTIGDRVFIHHGVTLGAGLPPSDPRRMVIGDRVTIGVGAILLGPITVGDDVMINAGSLVTKDIPSGSTVGGNPAVVKNGDGARLAARWNPSLH